MQPDPEKVIVLDLVAGRLPAGVDPESARGAMYLAMIADLDKVRALKATLPPMSPGRVERVVAILRGAPAVGDRRAG